MIAIDEARSYPNDEQPPITEVEAIRHGYVAFCSGAGLKLVDVARLLRREGYDMTEKRLSGLGRDGKLPIDVFEFWALLTAWAGECHQVHDLSPSQ